MNLKNMTVLVAGSGKSGIGAVELLQKIGSTIILYDGNNKLNIEDIQKKLKKQDDVEIVIGELPQHIIDRSDLMVLSPGIAIDAPFVNQVRDSGVEIWGEIELAYRVAKGRLIAITGTNGKTTTTALVGEIMSNYFAKADIVGNIGNPYTTTAYESDKDTVTVAEISSFQLETIHEFHPDVSAVLNITPDHLNRHYTMDNYANVKMSIAQNQNKNQVCILNYEDAIIREKAEQLTNKVIYFSSKQTLSEGVYLDRNKILYKENDKEVFVTTTEDTNLVGVHNIENIMAAIAISINMGVPVDSIRNTIKNFQAVEHRIEYVTTKGDVIYYNDSKGTNTDASIKAIEAMTRPTVLIAGGYDKKTSFDEWIESFNGKIKSLVLLGETANQIEQTARKHGYMNIVITNSLEEAVEISAKRATPGDAVLLSPACASWDMFDSYEQRGEMFKKLVKNL